MDKHLSVNVYDAEDNAVPASVTYRVKHAGGSTELGPVEIQGVKDAPTSIQIPTQSIDPDPVILLTATYKGVSKTVEVDTKTTSNTIIKLDWTPPHPIPMPASTPRPNPWINGSFYLAAFVVVLAVIAAVTSIVPWYSIPAVIIAAILALTIIGAFTLQEQLPNESFMKLMDMSFRNLPLIKLLGRRPKD